MKKFIVFVLCFSFVSSIFAQNNSLLDNQDNLVNKQVFDNQTEEEQAGKQISEADTSKFESGQKTDSEASGGLLQQYQTFSWKKIAKAKKYEILIEKQQLDNSWLSEISEQTTENRIEILLYPGNYRVAISVFNALGKKTSTTDWTPFIILNETQPYLYAESLKKSESWQSPLLTVKHEESTIIEEIDDEGSVVAREGDPANSIFLKGKNIFFPNTTFSLVPKENSEYGKPFESYVDLRDEVPLNIVRRDTENGGVVVSYNPSVLFSGYYDIVAKNPGGQTANLELLVFSADPPKIDSSKFNYDNHYKVSTIDFVRNGNEFEYTFNIEGTGFGNNTVFTLAPDNGFMPYPFTSSFEQFTSTLNVKSHKCLDKNGTISLEFKVPASAISTGYYKFTANNGSTGSDSLLILVNVISNGLLNPDVTKIKTKVDKANNSITYQLDGRNIDKDTNFSLISTYSEELDYNTRTKIDYVTSKKKGTRHILTGSQKELVPGVYALLIENTDASQIVYLNVDKRLGFSLSELSNSESEKMFLRPESKAAINKVNIPEKFEITPYDYNLKKKPKILFSSLGYDFGLFGNLKTSSGFSFDAYLDIFNFNWLRLDVGGNYYMIPEWDTSGFQAGADLFFEIPSFYFTPYIGAGFYTTVKYEQSDVSTFLRNYTVPISIGFKFVTALDFRYTLSVENVLNGPENYFIQDKFTIGVNIPIRGYRYVAKVYSTKAEIANGEVADGTQYKLKKNTELLEIDSPVVKGFEGNKNINTVKLSSNVVEIAQKAFANCENLESVELKNGLKIIETKAFANCNYIETLKIPESVVKVEDDAFAGWESDQIIRLNWTSDDEIERDLPGLIDCDAVVYYSDGVLFNTIDAEPFYLPENWDIEKDSFMNETNLVISAVKDNKNNKKIALTAEGCVYVDGGKRKNTYIKLDSSKYEQISYSKSGNPIRSVSFSAKLEGDVKVTLCFTDEEENKLQEYTIKSTKNKPKDFTFDIKNKNTKKIEGMYIEISSAEAFETSLDEFNFAIFDFEILK